MKKWMRFFLLPLFALVLSACGDSDSDTYFTVTIQNVSNTSNLFSPFAPGVWAVHSEDNLLFTEEQTATSGLELLAEDGDPSVSVTELQNDDKVIQFEQLSQAAITPGASYSFTFKADPGNYLSFATMFVKSNDLFFAPPQEGLALFTEGTPLTGDMTAKIRIWDAGTEDNQVPGNGDQQPLGGTISGGTSDPTPLGVRDRATFNDGHALPEVEDLIKVTISVEYR